MAIDQDKLNQFMQRVVGDIGAIMHAPLVVIGDRLGLYKAMAGAGPMTSSELAERTGTNERYVREWLCAQAAGGYVEYDPATRDFSLPPEHALALADESSPFFGRRSSHAEVSAGTSTSTTSSRGPSGFSAPGTPPIWWKAGSRRSTA